MKSPRSSALSGLFATAGLLAALCAPRAAAVPVSIDDFSSGFQWVSVNAATTFDSDTVAAASALGGSRYLSATLLSPAGSADALVVPGGNGLVIGGASSTAVVDVGVKWTPGGVDLTSGNVNNVLVLDFYVADPGGVAGSILFDFLFTSTGGDTAALSVAVPAIPPNTSTMLVDLSSATFVPMLGNTAFTANGTIDLAIHMDAAADFALNSIRTDYRSTVADGGSTLAMLGAVTGLLVTVKRRHKGRAGKTAA